VLVHGYGVTSRYMFPTGRLLARSGCVLLPTMPGWRGSERPRRPLSVGGLADTLAMWLRDENVTDAVVVGNSFGCQVVAELALRAPDRIAGVVLAGPTVEPAARSFPRMASRLMANLVHEPPGIAAIGTFDYIAFGPRHAVVIGRRALAHRIEDVLPLVPMPCLVVRGSRDGLISPGWAARCAQLAPAGRLAVIEGAAHAVNYSAPDRLAALVTDFARTLGPPRSPDG
jgi:pimeloyl-ACP methyl ester carboxylesterase